MRKPRAGGDLGISDLISPRICLPSEAFQLQSSRSPGTEPPVPGQSVEVQKNLGGASLVSQAAHVTHSLNYHPPQESPESWVQLASRQHCLWARLLCPLSDQDNGTLEPGQGGLY